jgi:hypothetical protein
VREVVLDVRRHRKRMIEKQMQQSEVILEHKVFGPGEERKQLHAERFANAARVARTRLKELLAHLQLLIFRSIRVEKTNQFPGEAREEENKSSPERTDGVDDNGVGELHQPWGPCVHRPNPRF